MELSPLALDLGYAAIVILGEAAKLSAAMIIIGGVVEFLNSALTVIKEN